MPVDFRICLCACVVILLCIGGQLCLANTSHDINEDTLVIGVLVEGNNNTITVEYNNMAISVVYINTRVKDIGTVYGTVRRLDSNSSIDVIVLLEPTTELLLYQHVISRNVDTPFLIWGDVPRPPSYRLTIDPSPNTHRTRTCSLNGTSTSSINPDDVDSSSNESGTPVTLGLEVKVKRSSEGQTNEVTRTLVSGPEVLSSLLQYLQWNRTIIVYEDYTYKDMVTLVGKLKLLYAVYHVADLHQMFLHINDTMHIATSLTDGHINFLVMCRLQCALQVLAMGNGFDERFKSNTTVLRYLSQWVVAVYGTGGGHSRLAEVAADIDNVLVVPIPNIVIHSRHTFFSLVDKGFLNIVLEDSPTDDWKQHVLKILSQKSSAANNYRACQAVPMKTLLWKPGPVTRQFAVVGYIHIDGNISVRSFPFPNSLQGYNGRQFHVSVITYPPFVIATFHNDTTTNTTNTTYSGFCIDVLKELSIVLNFTFFLTEVPDGNYGMVVDQQTMRFNGLIGQLQRREVDLIVGDVAITREREFVMDFTYPFYYGYSTVVMKRPDNSGELWQKLIKPLKIEVIALIWASLLLVAPIMYCMETRNTYYRPGGPACKAWQGSRSHNPYQHLDRDQSRTEQRRRHSTAHAQSVVEEYSRRGLRSRSVAMETRHGSQTFTSVEETDTRRSIFATVRSQTRAYNEQNRKAEQLRFTYTSTIPATRAVSMATPSVIRPSLQSRTSSEPSGKYSSISGYKTTVGLHSRTRSVGAIKSRTQIGVRASMERPPTTNENSHRSQRAGRASVSSRASHGSYYTTHNCRDFGCGLHSFSGVLAALYCTMLNEGMNYRHLPKSISGRTLLACWLLFTLVTVASYCGNLIAYLTVTRDKKPFDSLHEMIALGTYTWGTIGGTLWEQTFMTSERPAFRDIGKGLREVNKTDPTVLHTSNAFHINRVLTDHKYAFIGDDGSIKLAMTKNCDLLKTREKFMPLIEAFGFPKNSPHVRIFEKPTMKLHESGLMDVFKKKWWSTSRLCDQGNKPEAKPVTVQDVQGAFYLAAGGIAVSTLVCLGEVAVQKFGGCREKAYGGRVRCFW